MYIKSTLALALSAVTSLVSAAPVSENPAHQLSKRGWIECSDALGVSNTANLQNAINILNGNPR